MKVKRVKPGTGCMLWVVFIIISSYYFTFKHESNAVESEEVLENPAGMRPDGYNWDKGEIFYVRDTQMVVKEGKPLNPDSLKWGIEEQMLDALQR